MPAPTLTVEHVDLPDYEQQGTGTAKAVIGTFSDGGPGPDRKVLIVKVRDGGGSSIAMCELGISVPPID